MSIKPDSLSGFQLIMKTTVELTECSAKQKDIHVHRCYRLLYPMEYLFSRGQFYINESYK